MSTTEISERDQRSILRATQLYGLSHDAYVKSSDGSKSQPELDKWSALEVGYAELANREMQNMMLVKPNCKKFEIDFPGLWPSFNMNGHDYRLDNIERMIEDATKV